MARNNPMPPAPTNNIFRVKLGGTIEGQMTICTFYYADDKPVLSATRQDCVDIVTALNQTGKLIPSFTKAVSSDWTWGAIMVDVPTSPTLAPYGSGILGQGGGGAGHEPNAVSATIAKITAWKGQHGRSRISVPAVPTAWVLGSSLVEITGYADLITAIWTPVTGTGAVYTPGILSRQPPPSKTLGWAPMVTAAIRTYTGTCRRRKPGVGK